MSVTNDLDELRRALITSAPSSPVWDSREYEMYADRVFAAWEEDEFRLPLFFVRDETENCYGFYHHHSCPEADLAARLVPFRRAMEDMLREHGPGLESLAECPACHGADRLIRVYEEIVAKPTAREAAVQARMAPEREQEKARHALARTVACPSCGSPAGRNCRTSTGKLTSQDHAARVWASQAGPIDN